MGLFGTPEDGHIKNLFCLAGFCSSVLLGSIFTALEAITEL
jgi:hypothetical protein